MTKPERHAMVLVHTHSSGEEEWLCPVCGRRMMIRWSPTYKRTSLDAGDPLALHSASKGAGLVFGAVSIDATRAATPPAPDDAGPTDDELQAWSDGLRGIDFGDF